VKTTQTKRIEAMYNESEKIVNQISETIKIKVQEEAMDNNNYSIYNLNNFQLNLGLVSNHIPSVYQNTDQQSYLYTLQNNIQNKMPSSMYVDLGIKYREECTNNHVGFLGYNPKPTCKKFEDLIATIKW
jgi:hypothetical protein